LIWSMTESHKAVSWTPVLN